MARVAYARNTTRVLTGSYPDDGTSPVGTNEWNADPEASGLLGFTKVGATLDGSGVLSTKDDSATFTNEGGSSQAKQSTVIEVECNGSSTTDAVEKIDITDTNENDIVYLFKGTNGDTVTVTHTGSLSSNGQIQTLDASSATLNDAGKPISLIRRGNYWFEFGGGGASTPTDITVADESSDTTCFPLFVTAATGDLAPKSGSNLSFNSSSGILTATGFAGALTGNVTGNADTVTTNANLTGEVTSSGNATTITDNTVDEANLKVSNSPTNGYMLTAQSGNTGGLTWAAAGGGDPTDDVNYSGQYDIEDLQRASFEIQLNNFDESAQTASGQINADITGESQVYVKVIDSNNDGVFARLKKNGSIVNVQLA